MFTYYTTFLDFNYLNNIPTDYLKYFSSSNHSVIERL